MGLPRYVQVGGLRLTVVPRKIVKVDGDTCYAAYDGDRARIEVDESDAMERQCHGIAHEMVHAIFDESGLRFEMQESMGHEAAKYLEERVTRAVVTSYVGALRNLGWLRFPGER